MYIGTVRSTVQQLDPVTWEERLAAAAARARSPMSSSFTASPVRLPEAGWPTSPISCSWTPTGGQFRFLSATRSSTITLLSLCPFVNTDVLAEEKYPVPGDLHLFAEAEHLLLRPGKRPHQGLELSHGPPHIPGGRTPIVNEWLGISRASSQRAAAYQFARWMSFSKAGSIARLRIAGDEGLAVKSLPVTIDPQVQEAYFQKQGTPGLRKPYASLKRGSSKGSTLCLGTRCRGGMPRSRLEVGDVIWNSIRGTLKIAEWAPRLNDAANRELRDAAAAAPPSNCRTRATTHVESPMLSAGPSQAINRGWDSFPCAIFSFLSMSIP